MWPFRKLTAEQREDRMWRKYRDHLATTLKRQGYRGDPVPLAVCFAWADDYVAEARAEQAKNRAEALQDREES